MKPSIITIAGIVIILSSCASTPNITTQSYSHSDIASLESRAVEIDTMINVSARAYTDTYFSLGRAYIQIQEYGPALDALMKGLRLNARDYEYQFLAATAEFELSRVASAYNRARHITANCESKELRRKTQKLVRKIERTGFSEHPLSIPDMNHKTIYILPVDEVNALYMQSLKSRIESEFSVNVESISLPMTPSVDRGRDSLQSYYQSIKEWFIENYGQNRYDEVIAYLRETSAITDDESEYREFTRHIILGLEDGNKRWEEIASQSHYQYNADEILTQMRTTYRALIQGDNCLGVLAVTNHDIFAREYNFLFGWNSDDVAIMSYHRFDDSEAALSARIKRTVMQGFSSAGYLIGIPRCTTDTCARAYPHSLSEHDLKEDVLCDECKTNLIDVYSDLDS